MTPASPPDASATTDGRSLRRDRNRMAVIDAVLALYDSGNLAPSSDDIAERAGTSVRSVFRYFDDVDDMLRAAIGRQQERLEPLWTLDSFDGLPLDERIERFVAARVRLLDGMGNVGLVARMRAPFQPLIRAELDRVRATMRGQVALVFAPELAALGPDGAAVLAMLDVTCSWEARDLLRGDQGLSDAAARAAATGAIRRLLGTSV
ncbi:MAG TPA: TetR/AcrR family transcriptional regulator [Acidimicrobiales bacterium]